MTTKKLYYENLYAQEFDAAIVNLKNNPDGTCEIILNQTLFYPGGGGQPCDLGFIDGVEVINVCEDAEENIIHVLKNSLPENLNHVHGVINWERRFEHMQQHLGQHLFSAMLHKLHSLHTARMRIENDNVSLDTDVQIDLNTILEAEAAANEIVWQNLPVEIIFPSMDEIKLHARKMPAAKAVPPIRIVKVGEADYVPCCGTHVNSTGQVGLIKIISFENHKGGSRIYLRCGRAAYRWLNDLWHEVKDVENELVCGDFNITEKILNLKNQIHELKINAENLTQHFLTPLAENLISSAEISGDYKIIAHVMENSSQDDAKALSKILTANNNVIALIAAENSDGAFLMFSTNKDDKKIDVRNIFKQTISQLNGKGGGASFSAQGYCKIDNVEILNNALLNAKTFFEKLVQL